MNIVKSNSPLHFNSVDTLLPSDMVQMSHIGVGVPQWWLFF